MSSRQILESIREDARRHQLASQETNIYYYETKDSSESDLEEDAEDKNDKLLRCIDKDKDKDQDGTLLHNNISENQQLRKQDDKSEYNNTSICNGSSTPRRQINNKKESNALASANWSGKSAEKDYTHIYHGSNINSVNNDNIRINNNRENNNNKTNNNNNNNNIETSVNNCGNEKPFLISSPPEILSIPTSPFSSRSMLVELDATPIKASSINYTDNEKEVQKSERRRSSSGKVTIPMLALSTVHKLNYADTLHLHTQYIKSLTTSPMTNKSTHSSAHDGNLEREITPENTCKSSTMYNNNNNNNNISEYSQPFLHTSDEEPLSYGTDERQLSSLTTTTTAATAAVATATREIYKVPVYNTQQRYATLGKDSSDNATHTQITSKEESCKPKWECKQEVYSYSNNSPTSRNNNRNNEKDNENKENEPNEVMLLLKLENNDVNIHESGNIVNSPINLAIAGRTEVSSPPYNNNSQITYHNTTINGSNVINSLNSLSVSRSDSISRIENSLALLQVELAKEKRHSIEAEQRAYALQREVETYKSENTSLNAALEALKNGHSILSEAISPRKPRDWTSAEPPPANHSEWLVQLEAMKEQVSALQDTITHQQEELLAKEERIRLLEHKLADQLLSGMLSLTTHDSTANVPNVNNNSNYNSSNNTLAESENQANHPARQMVHSVLLNKDGSVSHRKQEKQQQQQQQQQPSENKVIKVGALVKRSESTDRPNKHKEQTGIKQNEKKEETKRIIDDADTQDSLLSSTLNNSLKLNATTAHNNNNNNNGITSQRSIKTTTNTSAFAAVDTTLTNDSDNSCSSIPDALAQTRTTTTTATATVVPRQSANNIDNNEKRNSSNSNSNNKDNIAVGKEENKENFKEGMISTNIDIHENKPTLKSGRRSKKPALAVISADDNTTHVAKGLTESTLEKRKPQEEDWQYERQQKQQQQEMEAEQPSKSFAVKAATTTTTTIITATALKEQPQHVEKVVRNEPASARLKLPSASAVVHKTENNIDETEKNVNIVTRSNKSARGKPYVDSNLISSRRKTISNNNNNNNKCSSSRIHKSVEDRPLSSRVMSMTSSARIPSKAKGGNNNNKRRSVVASANHTTLFTPSQKQEQQQRHERSEEESVVALSLEEMSSVPNTFAVWQNKKDNLSIQEEPEGDDNKINSNKEHAMVNTKEQQQQQSWESNEQREQQGKTNTTAADGNHKRHIRPPPLIEDALRHKEMPSMASLNSAYVKDNIFYSSSSFVNNNNISNADEDDMVNLEDNNNNTNGDGDGNGNNTALAMQTIRIDTAVHTNNISNTIVSHTVDATKSNKKASISRHVAASPLRGSTNMMAKSSPRVSMRASCTPRRATPTIVTNNNNNNVNTINVRKSSEFNTTQSTPLSTTRTAKPEATLTRHGMTFVTKPTNKTLFDSIHLNKQQQQQQQQQQQHKNLFSLSSIPPPIHTHSQWIVKDATNTTTTTNNNNNNNHHDNSEGTSNSKDVNQHKWEKSELKKAPQSARRPASTPRLTFRQAISPQVKRQQGNSESLLIECEEGKVKQLPHAEKNKSLSCNVKQKQCESEEEQLLSEQHLPSEAIMHPSHSLEHSSNNVARQGISNTPKSTMRYAKTPNAYARRIASPRYGTQTPSKRSTSNNLSYRNNNNNNNNNNNTHNGSKSGRGEVHETNKMEHSMSILHKETPANEMLTHSSALLTLSAQRRSLVGHFHNNNNEVIDNDPHSGRGGNDNASTARSRSNATVRRSMVNITNQTKTRPRILYTGKDNDTAVMKGTTTTVVFRSPSTANTNRTLQQQQQQEQESTISASAVAAATINENVTSTNSDNNNTKRSEHCNDATRSSSSPTRVSTSSYNNNVTSNNNNSNNTAAVTRTFGMYSSQTAMAMRIINDPIGLDEEDEVNNDGNDRDNENNNEWNEKTANNAVCNSNQVE